MPLITSTFSTLPKPLEVRAPADQVAQFLLHVEQSGKLYPLTEKIERVGDDVYRWQMKDRRVGTIHFAAVQVGRFTRQGNNVSWEVVEGHGGNLKNWGRWVIQPKQENSCTVGVETSIEVNLPLPGPLVSFASQLAQAEMKSNWQQYVMNIKKEIEGPNFVPVAEEPEAAAAAAAAAASARHSKAFEETRLSEPLRQANYKQQVSEYYDHVTDFYRSGWGDHFHFASFRPGEQAEAAIKRLEADVARSAHITKHSYVLDMGCGVGGPTTHVAQLTGCRIRGLNITKSQVETARKRAAGLGLGKRVEFDHGDGMASPYKDNSFDAVLFFESICHMPDKDGFWRECARVLKPGGWLAGSDWLQAERITEQQRREFIEPICDAHSCPHLGSLNSYANGMRAAGLRVSTARDLRDEGDIMPNWTMLDGKTIEAFRTAQADGKLDQTHEMLMIGAIALSEGARNGAFLLGRFAAQKPKGKM